MFCNDPYSESWSKEHTFALITSSSNTLSSDVIHIIFVLLHGNNFVRIGDKFTIGFESMSFPTSGCGGSTQYEFFDKLVVLHTSDGQVTIRGGIGQGSLDVTVKRDLVVEVCLPFHLDEQVVNKSSPKFEQFVCHGQDVLLRMVKQSFVIHLFVKSDVNMLL